MTLHDIAILVVGMSLGGMFISLVLLIRDIHDTGRTINAWLDYEDEERKSWKESKTQKERKAHAPWN